VAPSPDASLPMTPTASALSTPAGTPGDRSVGSRGGGARREAMLKAEAQRVARAVTILARFVGRFPRAAAGRQQARRAGQRLLSDLHGAAPQAVDVVVQAGKAETLVLELPGVPLTARIGEVRERVAAHFREQPDRVLLYLRRRRVDGSGGGAGAGVFVPVTPPEDRLDRDGATLEEEVALPVLAAAEMLGDADGDGGSGGSGRAGAARPRPVVTLLAKRIVDGSGPADAPLVGGGVGVRLPWGGTRGRGPSGVAGYGPDAGQQLGGRLYPAELIAPSQLEADPAVEGNLLLSSEHWLWTSGRMGSGAADGSINSSNSGAAASAASGSFLPPPPLPHRPDAAFDDDDDDGGEGGGASAPAAAASLPLAAHFRAHPEQLDQLLSLLELDVAVRRKLPLDLRAAVWGILQDLPTHPRVLGDIRTLAFFEQERWEAMFRERATYKLLYALQVMDALLTGPGLQAPAALAQWQARFVHLGHLEQLTGALHVMAALAQELPASTSSANLAAGAAGGLTGLAVNTTAAAAPSDAAIPAEVVALGTALLSRILLAFLAPRASPPVEKPGQGQGARTAMLVAEVARTAAVLVATARTVSDAMDALFALAKVGEQRKGGGGGRIRQYDGRMEQKRPTSFAIDRKGCLMPFQTK
jgi:hypothetical protein